MNWLHDISYFFAGAFLTNAVPHLVSGLTGHAFQSPFAKPPGKGLSSATVNVLWGFFNLVIGYLFLCRVGTFDWQSNEKVIFFGLGVLIMALMLALTFGKLHGGDRPDR